MCGIFPTVVEITQVGTGFLLSFAGILLACTLLNVAAAVMLARASLPVRLEARLMRVRVEVDAMGKAIEDFARDSAANQSVVRGLVEEAEGAFDRAERKRSSAAATLSRQRGSQPELPTSRADIINHMRAQGG